MVKVLAQRKSSDAKARPSTRGGAYAPLVWVICAVFTVLHAATGETPVPLSTVSYKIGDKAQEDIIATLPFDVEDAQATAALKASKGRAIAPIYRRCDGITNTIAGQFLKAFAEAHARFSNAVNETYHQPRIDNATIASPDFGYFLTAYNVENRKFPVPPALAAAWAGGDSGADLRDKWLGLLLRTMSGPVQPDGLPPHFLYENEVRVIPVTNLNQELTLVTPGQPGYVMSADKVPALSPARWKFRQEFSANEQPLAAALAPLLQPNCVPDVALTREARDYSVRQIVVASHFDAGQVIVHRGAAIDANAMAALDAMNHELMAADHDRTRLQQEQLQSEQAAAELVQLRAKNEQAAAQLAQQQQEQQQFEREQVQRQAEQARVQSAAIQEQALIGRILTRKIQTRDDWLAAALVTVALITVLGWWHIARRQRRLSVSAPARLQRMEKYPAAFPAELAPVLAQTLKEAVVQGLAAQRAELLETQRLAAAEIAQLADRLDQLQAPVQERLHAYEERIHELERELAERTAENRELLKLKIGMMRRQVEMERSRVKLN